MCHFFPLVPFELFATCLSDSVVPFEQFATCLSVGPAVGWNEITQLPPTLQRRRHWAGNKLLNYHYSTRSLDKKRSGSVELTYRSLDKKRPGSGCQGSGRGKEGLGMHWTRLDWKGGDFGRLSFRSSLSLRRQKGREW